MLSTLSLARHRYPSRIRKEGTTVPYILFPVLFEENSDLYQWEIISLGNGVCRIKNVQEDAFLVPEMFADGWTPVLSKTLQPREWDISSLGNMTYS